MYGIICFFWDKNNKPCKLAIGIPELEARHLGTHIAHKVCQVLNQFGIQGKLGYFTLDNAGNCDTAMDVIGMRYSFDGRKRCTRCFGHILNLSAKMLLFGGDINSFELELEGMPAFSDDQFKLWQKRGPVGKLHNLVVEINRADRLTYLLYKLQDSDISKDPLLTGRKAKPLDVVQDNNIKWLS